MEDDDKWTVVDESFTKHDHATSGDLELRTSVLPETVSVENVQGEEDFVYDGPVTIFRPVVHIAASDVSGDRRELNQQIFDQLGDLLISPESGGVPKHESFLKALDSPTEPFSNEDAQTWRDLLKEATSDGRITALRPGEITVDPTMALEYDRLPEDHVWEYYEIALEETRPKFSVRFTECVQYLSDAPQPE